eukprot:TRINITY_DN41865_c0_g1_i1.p1 TRINITY_DN41865_c0_g1~~TRINITY_DN41865_c0_g1_i1.p1  ORF type:complete len:456 (-),score=99.53 TRINITY_DN41865_c0_g1_i1:364-1731(-)
MGPPNKSTRKFQDKIKNLNKNASDSDKAYEEVMRDVQEITSEIGPVRHRSSSGDMRLSPYETQQRSRSLSPRPVLLTPRPHHLSAVSSGPISKQKSDSSIALTSQSNATAAAASNIVSLTPRSGPSGGITTPLQTNPNVGVQGNSQLGYWDQPTLPQSSQDLNTQFSSVQPTQYQTESQALDFLNTETGNLLTPIPTTIQGGNAVYNAVDVEAGGGPSTRADTSAPTAYVPSNNPSSTSQTLLYPRNYHADPNIPAPTEAPSINTDLVYDALNGPHLDYASDTVNNFDSSQPVYTDLANVQYPYHPHNPLQAQEQQQQGDGYMAGLNLNNNGSTAPMAISGGTTVHNNRQTGHMNRRHTTNDIGNYDHQVGDNQQRRHSDMLIPSIQITPCDGATGTINETFTDYRVSRQDSASDFDDDTRGSFPNSPVGSYTSEVNGNMPQELETLSFQDLIHL